MKALGPLIARGLSSGLVVGLALALAGCGGGSPGAQPTSGVSGKVHLGPQCPVQTVEDPCADKPASDVEVTVSERRPGDPGGAGTVVASGRTGGDGSFRIAVDPGDYVVTAKAGMSCELMDARVVAGAFATVDVPCDTGIR